MSLKQEKKRGKMAEATAQWHLESLLRPREMCPVYTQRRGAVAPGGSGK